MDYIVLKEQFNLLLDDYKRIEVALDVAKIENEINNIELDFTTPGFWDDHENSTNETKKLSALKDKLQLFNVCKDLKEGIEFSFELLEDDPSHDLIVSISAEIKELSEHLNIVYNNTLLSGKYDDCNVIIDIHAGAGGTESQDWVEMLYRMYTRYCNKKQYAIKVITHQNGDMAGIKNVSFEVSGSYVFGHLKSESGVHRLIRISPFDPSGKRHTSFASVDIIPILDKIAEVEINKADLKVDTFRASGAGGQSVNTTDSAVRITHLPTGIVVSCQNERSQVQNKEYAMKILHHKLAVLEEDRRKTEVSQSMVEKSDNGFGSQIRTYTLQPYALVKDHRTNHEVGNVKAVLDGEIDEFVIKYLEDINY